jgi:hypothetical protein
MFDALCPEAPLFDFPDAGSSRDHPHLERPDIPRHRVTLPSRQEHQEILAPMGGEGVPASRDSSKAAKPQSRWERRHLAGPRASTREFAGEISRTISGRVRRRQGRLDGQLRRRRRRNLTSRAAGEAAIELDGHGVAGGGGEEASKLGLDPRRNHGGILASGPGGGAPTRPPRACRAATQTACCGVAGSAGLRLDTGTPLCHTPRALARAPERGFGSDPDHC